MTPENSGRIASFFIVDFKIHFIFPLQGGKIRDL